MPEATSPAMRQLTFYSLMEALTFVKEHGGPVKSHTGDGLGDYVPASGAYAPASDFVELADGSIFGVEAYSNGPLSAVTPDEDYGVNLLGFVTP